LIYVVAYRLYFLYAAGGTSVELKTASPALDSSAIAIAVRADVDQRNGAAVLSKVENALRSLSERCFICLVVDAATILYGNLRTLVLNFYFKFAAERLKSLLMDLGQGLVAAGSISARNERGRAVAWVTGRELLDSC
jgi:hypothetical protein